MISGRLIIALGACALTGWAQSSAGVAGPVTGFIFDGPSGNIRPMLGIPGAAYLGGASATGLTAASVAPDGSAALAVQKGQLILYTGLRNAAPKASPVPNAIANPDHFAWSEGAVAAAYSSQTSQAQILNGSAAIDLSSLPGKVTALATDGQRIMVGVASAGIYIAAANAPLQRIAGSPSPSAIALSGANLYFADNQTQQIWQVQNYATTPAPAVFANDSSINGPVGIQTSADGKRLYAANAGNQMLEVYDTASRTPTQSIALAFTPTHLDRFGDASVFLMNATGQGPLYVARDSATAKAAVFFVPVPPNRRPLKAPIRPM